MQTQGLTLIIHDRYVTGAGSILPGVTGIRDFSDDSNIDFPVGSPFLAWLRSIVWSCVQYN